MSRSSCPSRALLKGHSSLIRSSALILFAALVFVHTPSAQAPSAVGLATPRWGHSATLLPGGRILVAGGANQGGILGTTEILDLNGGQPAAGPLLLTARVDHTATPLDNGLVLIAGGTGASGPLASTELFNPATGAILAGPRMTVARAGHTATVLGDGSVLVAGGDPAGTAEIFAGGVFTPTGRMTVPRLGPGAAVMADGRVMVAGGIGPGGPLDSVEIFSAGGFTPVAETMQAARVRPALHVLPDGKVQIIGGDSGFSMEMFDPAFEQFKAMSLLPPLPGVVAATLATPGRHALLTTAISGNPNVPGGYAWALDRDGYAEVGFGSQVLVLGGGSGGQALGSGVLFPASPASVTTDYLDYSPDSQVVISGNGWIPGETVSLLIHQEPQMRPDTTLTAVADGTGAIFSWQFETIAGIDYGTVFTITAAGSASGYAAQTAFADGAANVNFATSGLPAGISVSVSYSGTNNGGHAISGSVTFTSPGPSSGGQGIIGTLPGSSFSYGFPATVTSGSDIYTFDSGAPASPFNTDLGAAATTVIGTYKKKLKDQTIAFGTLAGKTYGDADFTVSATATSGLPVTFAATAGNCTVAGTAVHLTGAGSCTITASQAGNNTWAAAPDIQQSFNIAKAIQTVTFGTLASKTYGDPDFTVSATASSGLAVTFAGSGNCTVAGSTVHIVSAGSCTVTASQAGDGNYNAAPDVSQTFSIQKADAKVSVSGYTGIYDANAHGATGTATGLGGVDLSASLTLGATFVNVPGGTAHWTFAGGTNYNDQSGDVAIVINKANAVVTVGGYTGVYDGNPHGATGTAVGVGGANLAAGLNLGATFTDVPGGTAHWTFTGGTNYNDQSGDVAIVINKADATVVVNGYTGTYDAIAHGASGTATGVGGVDLSAGLTFGDKFTDVPGGTAHWTFAGGANYNDQSGDVAIVINKADATVTVNGYTGTYDGSAHGGTGTATGVGGVDLSTGLSLGDTFTNVPGGTAHWTFTGGTNYNDQSGDVAIVITKADATVTVNGYTGTYDGAAHGASGTATGVGGADLSAWLNLGDKFTNVPGGTAHWTFTGGGNYNGQSGDVAIVIGKAAATVHVNGYAGTYDGTAHGASGTATGVGGADLSAQLNFGSAFTNVPGGTAHWTFAGGGNYTDQSGDVSIAISKANPTVSVAAYNVIYDGSAHTATGTATGVSGETLVGLNLAGTTHTDAGDYAADAWTFTDGTGNYNNQAGSVHDVIAKASQAITFGALVNKAYGEGDFTVSASATSGLPVVFGAAGGCTVSGSTVHIMSAGSCTVTASQSGNNNYKPAADVSQTFSVLYSVLPCLGEPGHQILRPIDPTGGSVFKQGSTTPAKFRVCDVRGNSVGTPDVVSWFRLIKVVAGTMPVPDEAVDSTTPDSAFRWDPTAQQWIFNISTKQLSANATYAFQIRLKDGTDINFQYGLK